MPFSASETSLTAVSSRSVGVSRLAAGLPRFNWVTLLTDCLVRAGGNGKVPRPPSQCARGYLRFHSSFRGGLLIKRMGIRIRHIMEHSMHPINLLEWLNV